MSERDLIEQTPEPIEQTPEPADLAASAGVEPTPAYHLRLDGQEPDLVACAVRLLISDEAHEPTIRRIARAVLAELDRARSAGEPLIVPLSPEGMKITHTAVKLLLDDLRRGQADEQRVLKQIIAKLPDEHAIRAIAIE